MLWGRSGLETMLDESMARALGCGAQLYWGLRWPRLTFEINCSL